MGKEIKPIKDSNIFPYEEFIERRKNQKVAYLVCDMPKALVDCILASEMPDEDGE